MLTALKPGLRKILPGSRKAILDLWQALVGGGETSLHTHPASAITSGTLAINRGGTNASTAAGARTNLGSTTVGDAVFIAASQGAAQTALGLVPGTDVQAYDATLAAVAGVTTAADKIIYFTGIDAAAAADLSAFGRTLIDDADAATARATLALVIGTNVQAWDTDLDAIAALAHTEGAPIYSNGSAWTTSSRTAFEMMMHLTPTAWTNMPAAATELFGVTVNRRKLDATGYRQFRINARHSVVGAAGSKLYLQYSTDNVTFADAESGGHSSGDYALDATASTPYTTTWVNLASGAKADVYWRIVGQTGNGAADPNITSIGVQFR